MLKKIDKQPKDDFEGVKKQMLKDRDQAKEDSAKRKTEISEDGIDRMNGPMGGVELNDQEWEAIKVETVKRTALKKDKGKGV